MGRGSHRVDKNTGDPLKKYPYSCFSLEKQCVFLFLPVVHEKEKKLNAMLIYV